MHILKYCRELRQLLPPCLSVDLCRTQGGILITGILILSKNNQLFLTQPDRIGKQKIFSGQYLDLCVNSTRIPVRVRYSDRECRWFFEGMPDLDIFRCKLMLKQ